MSPICVLGLFIPEIKHHSAFHYLCIKSLSMLRWSMIVLSILSLYPLMAQQVRVVDAQNGAPVERVLVHNEKGTNSILTDIYGKANVEAFNPDEIIIFQHPSYNILRISMEDIPSSGIIRLERRVIELSEFVVSANKWEQDKGEVPLRIASLGPSEVRIQNTQTAADALGSTGEVFIQKSQLGGGSPMIRGFAANSVLIVVDGVRMNNAIFRGGNLQNVILIDPLTIDNAEVVFGPGSVIYGSDALGGVMDFHTLQPALSYDSSMLVSAEYFNRVSSANQEFTGHLHLNLGWRKFASHTSFTYSSFGDLKAGSNYPSEYPEFGKRPYYQSQTHGKDTVMQNSDPSQQTPSAYNQKNFSQKFRYSPNQHWDFRYNLTYSTSSNIPRYDRLILWEDSLPEYAEWYYGPQEWMMNQVGIEHKKQTAVYNQARVLLTRQDIEESRHDRKFNDEWGRHRTENVVAYTLNLDASKEAAENYEVFYGVEAFVNDVVSEAYEENYLSGESLPVATRYPDGKNIYYSAAAYVQNKYKPSTKLTLQGGLRYTHYGLRSDFDMNFLSLPYDEIELDQGAFNGSLGAVYQPREHLYYRFSLSSGFRAPNLDDIAKVFDSEPGSVVVPNPGLKPEFAYNVETGVSYRKGDLSLDVDAFYTFVEDVIVREDFSYNGMDSIIYDGSLSRVQALVNAAQARVYGVSLNTYAALGASFTIKQTLTWVEGYEVEGKVPLRHTPPVFGRTSVGWNPGILNILAYAEYNGWKRWDDLAPSEQGKPHLYTEDGSPAWYTLNIKVSAEISPDIYLSTGLENILDRHYRPYSSGISAPGRNFILSLRAKW